MAKPEDVLERVDGGYGRSPHTPVSSWFPLALPPQRGEPAGLLLPANFAFPIPFAYVLLRSSTASTPLGWRFRGLVPADTNRAWVGSAPTKLWSNTEIPCVAVCGYLAGSKRPPDVDGVRTSEARRRSEALTMCLSRRALNSMRLILPSWS